ncbi:MAG: trans-sulfuration enzyme family protein [Runella sp.]
MHIETLCLRATHAQDANAAAVAPPLYLSTTFEREPDNSLPYGYLYSRAANPTRDLLEKAYCQLEGGEVAMAFASGQAATATLFQCLTPNDHVLIPDDAYYGTPTYLIEILGQWGLSFSRVDMTDLSKIAAAIQPNTRLIWIETPSNPLLKITDIQAVVTLAQARGVYVACDNTWATPILQRPLDLGCDVVMHSATKYFGGHSDLLSGALIFKRQDSWAEKARKIQTLGGAVTSPFDCWLILRGLKTLPLRVRQQSENANKIANFLTTLPQVEAVHYPFLFAHQGYEIAQLQMNMGGAMFSIQMKEGKDAALKVISRVKLFTRATSLGGVESLIEHRATAEGVHSTSPPNLIRFSIGLEHPDDLMADLQQAIS